MNEHTPTPIAVQLAQQLTVAQESGSTSVAEVYNNFANELVTVYYLLKDGAPVLDKYLAIFKDDSVLVGYESALVPCSTSGQLIGLLVELDIIMDEHRLYFMECVISALSGGADKTAPFPFTEALNKAAAGVGYNNTTKYACH